MNSNRIASDTHCDCNEIEMKFEGWGEESMRKSGSIRYRRLNDRYVKYHLFY